MAKHSHWHNIQLKKGKADRAKAGVFSKLAKNITVAAKDGGGDMSFNFKLRMTVEAAKAMNMPNDNIQRAIDRGTGGGDGVVLEEAVYEGFGPGGIALMIACVTDNKNRSVAEVKIIASKNGGTIGSSGSVAWMFDRKGMIAVGDASSVKDRDAFELSMIDAGADDIKWADDALEVLCAPDDLAKVVNALLAQGPAAAGQGLKTDDVRIGYIPKTPVAVEDGTAKAELDKLIELLDDHDDVEAVYTNEA